MSKVKKAYIDDQHKYKVSAYRKVKNQCKEIPTDHNAFILDLEIPVGKINQKITKWNFNEI